MIDAPIIGGAWIQRRLKGRTNVGNKVYYALVPQKANSDGTTIADDSKLPAIVYSEQAGTYPGRRAGQSSAYLTFFVRMVIKGNAPGSQQATLQQIRGNLSNTDGSPLEDFEQGYTIRSWFERAILPPPELGPGGVLYHHPGALFRIQITPAS